MLVEAQRTIALDPPVEPADLAVEWDKLAARALVPAGLNSGWFFAPLFQHLKTGKLAAVRSGSELIMALPVVRSRWPLPLVKNWVTPLSASGLPHIDHCLGKLALESFVRHAGAPVMLTGIPAAGPFWDTLRAASAQFTVLATWQRAALRPKGTFEAWFGANFDRKRRKEYRRLRTRLSEQGSLECRALRAGDDVEPWVKGLLELEAQGWKGKRGTALKSNQRVAKAFAEICRNLHKTGALRFWSLTLDGRTVATLFAVVEKNSAWLGKIAYDEAFAKFSPGVLLILDATEAFFKEGNIACVDSCAIPDHPMIDHLWKERLAMADVMVAGATVSGGRFALTAGAERLRRCLRSSARDLFYALTRRHRS